LVAVVVLVMVYVLDVNVVNSLSVSMAGLLREKADVVEESEDKKDLSPNETRQLLGFVEYPAVRVKTELGNVFSGEGCPDCFVSGERSSELPVAVQERVLVNYTSTVVDVEKPSQ